MHHAFPVLSIVLGILLAALAPFIGCSSDEIPLSGDMLPEERAEDLAATEAKEEALVTTPEAEAVNETAVAEEGVVLYGTVPAGLTALIAFKFNKPKDIALAELVQHPVGAFEEEWLIKKVRVKTGVQEETVRQVAAEAAEDLKRVIGFIKEEEAMNRYTQFVEAERDIVRLHDNDLSALQEGMDTLFKEEFEISFNFAHNTLLRIHLEEKSDDSRKVLGSFYGYADLVFTFGLGRELFPEISEEEALKRFRMLARAGRTNLIPHE